MIFLVHRMNTDIQNIPSTSPVPPSFEGGEWTIPEEILIPNSDNYIIKVTEEVK